MSIRTRTLRRSVIIALTAISAFLLLLVKIMSVQTFGYDKYQTKVIEQMTTETAVKADRGKILDRNGNLLAGNITTYRVFISPLGIKRADKGNSQSLSLLISQKLSEILGKDCDYILKQTTYTNYLDRTVARNVDEKTAEKVRLLIDEYSLEDQVFVEASSSRYYPYGSLASHIIGFTGSDGAGLYGLEYQYNEYLSGVDGKYITARDSLGNEMPYEYRDYIAATDGNTLITTIDTYIQASLEEQIEAAAKESGAENRACGIVMDVKTGAILAMATTEGFDLNEPFSLNDESQIKLENSGFSVESDDYKAYKKQLLLEMWSNKAVAESYIPGSTFKIVTSAMALEDKKVSLNESVCCNGSLTVCGRNIHCHKVKGHGSLTYPQGLQQSCNVWFMTLGLRIGSESFYSHFSQFGYMAKTGIDLPGESSSVISRSMTELDLAIYAFGQNFNVTPIQQICAVAAVANGGSLMTPYLVSEILDANGNTVYKHEPEAKQRVASVETCKTISKILEEGVAGEGGAKNAYAAGYRVAAKTGTSEKKGAASAEKEKYICSCVGYAPADDPEIAVIIIVDEPTKGVIYGSTVAAPYISKFIESVMPYLGTEPIYTEDEIKNMAISLPDFTSWTVGKVKAYAESLGIEVEVKGEGDTAVSQSPAAGKSIERSFGKIILYTDGEIKKEDLTVPDLIGKSALEANLAITAKGFNIKITGARNYYTGGVAKVISQFPAAGTTLEEGGVINIELRYEDEKDLEQ